MWSRRLSDDLGMDEEAFMTAFEKVLNNDRLMNKLSKVVSKELKADFESLKTEISNLKDTIRDKDTKITNLETVVTEKEERIKSLEKKHSQYENDIDSVEQYTRRNSIRVAGLPEVAHEDPENVVFTLFNDTMGMAIDGAVLPEDLDRVHRVGKPEAGKDRQMLVKFATYRARRRVFSAKRRLNPRHRDWTMLRPELQPETEVVESNGGAGADQRREHSKVYITEDLTRSRANLLFQARKAKRDSGRITGCWSHDGQVLVKDLANKVIPINSVLELTKVTATNEG